MSYGNKSLNELRDEAYGNSKAKGFHETPKSVGDDFALIHSEISEALEDYRAGHDPAMVWYIDPRTGERTERGSHTSSITGFDIPHKPCGIPSEMADVIIRVLDFSGKYGIDIERAVRDKMAFNETRPHKHGKVM